MDKIDIEWLHTINDIVENDNNLTACIRQIYLESI